MFCKRFFYLNRIKHTLSIEMCNPIACSFYFWKNLSTIFREQLFFHLKISLFLI